ncbi:hypothetical protein BD779DRAFT_1520749 [Infundibulicybe gibba]|nr:hypothetical protein BD779DRAFT_1520749 [Infundibulicybe gibba]
MIWEDDRWDIIRVESVAENCSFCQCKMYASPRRYKCAICENIEMCAGCYSQVHEVHPNHAILLINESYTVPGPKDAGDGESLSHGIECANCRFDIVGQRFYCLICKNMNTCSDCQLAGLPSILGSTNGDVHTPLHSMFIFPFPMDPSQLGDLFRRMREGWTKNELNFSPPRAMPGVSSVGSGHETAVNRGYSHNISCSACVKLIIGTRYQCGSCPSLPSGYSLCQDCEEKSHLVHDPNHIFFRLPRPVDRPLQSSSPLIRALYSTPAGPPLRMIQANQKDYYKKLLHPGAKCNRCIGRSDCIKGVWFRCANCPDMDLCDQCMEEDSHDANHIFLVFKSLVDMTAFGNFVRLGEPSGPQIIPYAVYY